MNSRLQPVAAVEAATGITRHVLRMWERRYGFPQPLRDGNGERQYPPEQIERLKLIGRLLEQGHRPGKIVALPQEALVEMAEATSRARSEAGDVQRLLRAAETHGAVEFRRRLQEILLRGGLAAFVLETVRPLIKEIGSACAAGEVDRRTEQIYTEHIDRVLREAMAPLHSSGPPRILLTTLEPERHGLGLLMFKVLARLEGADAIPVGLELTPAAIANMAASASADIVALSFSGASAADARSLLGELRALLGPSVEIWCGGAGARLLGRPWSGVRILPDLEDGLAALRSWRASRVTSQAGARFLADAAPHEIAGSAAAFRRAIHVPEQRMLFSYWLRRRRRGAAFPQPADIDLQELPRLAPNVGVIDVLEPGPRFHYRIVGAGLAESFTRPIAGRPLRAVKNSAYGRFLESVYTTSLALRAPIISRGIAHYPKDVQRRYHRIVLPLSSDGSRIDALLYSTVGFAMQADDPRPPADDILYCEGSIVALPEREGSVRQK